MLVADPRRWSRPARRRARVWPRRSSHGRFAQVLGIDFRRIQFTPDLMPADVTGSSVWDQAQATFDFRPGPVFCNLLLADEINRTPPKTQAALLEAMAEQQVTIEGVDPAARRRRSSSWPPRTRSSTRAPIRSPRPSSTASCSAPGSATRRVDDEWQVLARRLDRTTPDLELDRVVDRSTLLAMRAAVETVHVSEAVGRYLVALVTATRERPARRGRRQPARLARAPPGVPGASRARRTGLRHARRRQGARGADARPPHRAASGAVGARRARRVDRGRVSRAGPDSAGRGADVSEPAEPATQTVLGRIDGVYADNTAQKFWAWRRLGDPGGSGRARPGSGLRADRVRDAGGGRSARRPGARAARPHGLRRGLRHGRVRRRAAGRVARSSTSASRSTATRVLEGDLVAVRVVVQALERDRSTRRRAGVAARACRSPKAIRPSACDSVAGESRSVELVLRADQWGLQRVGTVVIRARDRTGLIVWEGARQRPPPAPGPAGPGGAHAPRASAPDEGPCRQPGGPSPRTGNRVRRDPALPAGRLGPFGQLAAHRPARRAVDQRPPPRAQHRRRGLPRHVRCRLAGRRRASRGRRRHRASRSAGPGRPHRIRWIAAMARAGRRSAPGVPPHRRADHDPGLRQRGVAQPGRRPPPLPPAERAGARRCHRCEDERTIAALGDLRARGHRSRRPAGRRHGRRIRRRVRQIGRTRAPSAALGRARARRSNWTRCGRASPGSASPSPLVPRRAAGRNRRGGDRIPSSTPHGLRLTLALAALALAAPVGRRRPSSTSTLARGERRRHCRRRGDPAGSPWRCGWGRGHELRRPSACLALAARRSEPILASRSCRSSRPRSWPIALLAWWSIDERHAASSANRASTAPRRDLRGPRARGRRSGGARSSRWRRSPRRAWSVPPSAQSARPASRPALWSVARLRRYEAEHRG